MTNYDKLNYFVKAMSLIENYPEKIMENELKATLEDHNLPDFYEQFSQFALGGKTPYVQVMSNNAFKLTQLGSRKLYELKNELNQERIYDKQTGFNKIIASTTVILALVGVLNFSYEFLGIKLNNDFMVLITGGIIGILIGFFKETL